MDFARHDAEELLMTYLEELESHRLHSFLSRVRMGWRYRFISRLPCFMVGTRVLFWQIDTLIYRAEMAIEHKIWSQRLSEYREKLKTLNDQSYRKCRNGVAGDYTEGDLATWID